MKHVIKLAFVLIPYAWAIYAGVTDPFQLMVIAIGVWLVMEAVDARITLEKIERHLKK